jgi:hypothetical protein
VGAPGLGDALGSGLRPDDVELALGLALLGFHAWQLCRVARVQAGWLPAALATTLAAIAAVPWFSSWLLVWPIALAALLTSPPAWRAMLAFLPPAIALIVGAPRRAP